MPIFPVVATLAASFGALGGSTTATTTLTSTPALADTGTVAPPISPTSGPEAESTIDIVVTGSRTEKRLSDTAVATELINRKELAESGADNLLEVLEERQGIQLERSTSGAGIRLRGLDPQEVLILIDGERVPGRIRGAIDPWRFDVESIEQIEIVKGSASALYGSDAMGGVINIIPRKPKPGLGTNVRASYGSFDSRDVTGAVGYRRGRGALELSGGYHHTGGFDLTPDDEVTTGPLSDALSISANGSWDADAETRFRFRGDARRTTLDAVDLVRPRALIDREEQIDNWSLSAGPDLKLGGGRLRATVSFASFRQHIDSNQRGGDFYDAIVDNRHRSTQATVQFDRPFPRHLVTVGLDGINEEQEVDFLGTGDESRRRGAIYAQDEWAILEEDVRLVLVPGFRFDADTQFGSQPSPKIAARFDPLDWIVLRGSYALGYRAPTFEELHVSFTNPGSGYVVIGNPDLDPVSSHNVTFDAEISPLDFLELRAGAYYNDISNLIDTRRGEGVTELGYNIFTYQNVASARIVGLELGARIKIADSLTIDGGYDLTDTYDRAQARELPGRARHRGTIRALWSHQAWGLKASARASFVGKQPYFTDLDSDGVMDVGDPYVTMDLRVAETVLDGALEIEAGCENLLDAGDPVLLVIPPRSFFVALSGHWSTGLDGEP